MIRHIVFFSVPEKDNLAEVEAGLKLLTTIPHARRLEIGRNIGSDLWSNDVDLVVYGEFDSEAELAAYRAHPNYKESTRRVRPLRELRIAADFVSGG